MGKYITVDISGLNEFVDALGAAGKTEFKKELRLFMNGAGLHHRKEKC